MVRRHGALIAPTWDGFTQRETASDAALRWASDGGFYSVLPCVPPADGSHGPDGSDGSDGGRARKGPTERDSAGLCRQDAGSTLRRFIRRWVGTGRARLHVVGGLPCGAFLDQRPQRAVDHATRQEDSVSVSFFFARRILVFDLPPGGVGVGRTFLRAVLRRLFPVVRGGPAAGSRSRCLSGSARCRTS